MAPIVPQGEEGHACSCKKINRSHTHTHRQRTTPPTPTHTTRTIPQTPKRTPTRAHGEERYAARGGRVPAGVKKISGQHTHTHTRTHTQHTHTHTHTRHTAHTHTGTHTTHTHTRHTHTTHTRHTHTQQRATCLVAVVRGGAANPNTPQPSVCGRRARGRPGCSTQPRVSRGFIARAPPAT